MDFYNSSSNWNQQGTIPTGSGYTQISFSSSDSQYLHDNFRVRIRTESASEFYLAHSWKIDGGMDYTHARIDTTYKFTGVDFANFTFNDLIVEFGEYTSSEVLDFSFESGDSTPDIIVASNQNSTFSVNLQPYLTGSECYVNIRDVFDLADNQTDSWQITRMYIRHANSPPKNDQTPRCTNLDDGDNLYARHNLYEFTTSVLDYNGVSQIEYVELRSYDSTMTHLRWAVRFDEDNKTFTEEAGMSFIELVGSDYVNTSNHLYITFRIYIEWEHPDSTDDCLQQYVEDSFGDSDEDTYFVDYDYETRLDISGLSLNDEEGVNNWGDINGEMTASGTLIYYGSSNIPTSSVFDVWASASLSSGAGPWIHDSLDLGYFTITMETDDTPGIDIYSFDVVLNGTGPEGESYLHSVVQSTYISDQIIVHSITAERRDLDLSEPSVCFVTLYYEVDGSFVTDGTVVINGISAIYTGNDGIWSFSETYSTTQSRIYDSVVVNGNYLGITEVNQNSQSLTVTWGSSLDDVEQLSMFIMIISIVGVVTLFVVLVVMKKYPKIN